MRSVVEQKVCRVSRDLLSRRHLERPTNTARRRRQLYSTRPSVPSDASSLSSHSPALFSPRLECPFPPSPPPRPGPRSIPTDDNRGYRSPLETEYRPAKTRCIGSDYRRVIESSRTRTRYEMEETLESIHDAIGSGRSSWEDSQTRRQNRTTDKDENALARRNSRRRDDYPL